jgi:protein tyrosine/serine phosphatase
VQDDGVRPDYWAQPVVSSHVNNFYKLDEHVYRSAQPDSEGAEQISDLGIRHILNLRMSQTDQEVTEGLGVTLHNVKMHVLNIRDEDIVNALRIITSADGPVLIHCLHGSDRTGVVAAMYRVVLQNWSKEEALNEMVSGGYGFHHIFINIKEYIINADVVGIKNKINNTPLSPKKH